LLIFSARHPNGKRKIKEIWHGRIFWEGESNTTMLRAAVVKNTSRNDVDMANLPYIPTKDIVKSVVAICAATRSKSDWRSLDDTTLQNVLIPSIQKTISLTDRSKYDVRLYLAADHDDQFWLNNKNSVKTPDWLSVHVGFYEVPEHKIPFNPMMRAAYNDGAEYMVRINDDSEFITSDWVSKAIAKLESYEPPNLGMVGPNCLEGNTAIMTHDMVHRTHLDIFEYYYPDVFSAWWIDDWISKVYGPQRSTKMMDWAVKHHTHKHGTRYEIQHHEAQLLKAELEKGTTKIETWLLGLTKFKQNCENIQRKIKENSWNSLSKTLKDSWKTLKCEKSLIVKTPAPPPSILKKCLLVANGPSLNKQTWDFTDDMDYILGMNKIYLGLNKYSLPLNTYVVVNPLVAEQSVDPILHKLDATTEKFVTINRKNKFPTGADIRFFKSGGPVFSHTLDTLNEGWTVTYVGLQILYIKGCQTVYIVGMDHNYKQQGAPNSMQTMKGDDPNHFDSTYFKGNQWHLADLKQNEKHYKIARDEYEKDGRQIIDATIDGHCTVFEKMKSMKDAKTPSITQKCKNVVKWEKSDHGWDVCTDVISDNCVVYAIGIGRFSEWDQMMSKPPYNCEVHSFDPTPTGKKHVQSLKNPGFIYHDFGVGLIDGYQDVFVPTSGDQFTKTSTTPRNGRKPTTISIPVKKIKTIMRELNHASLDMLKIDIEGGEIEILRDLFSSTVDIKSVCAEFHSESPLPLNEIDQLFKNAKYVPYIAWKSVRAYLGVYLGERCWFKSPAKINPTAKISPSVDTKEYIIKESSWSSTGCNINCPYKHIGEYLKEPVWNFEGHSASKTNHVKSSTLVNFLGITNRYYIDIGSVSGSELSSLQNWKGLAIDPRETPSQSPTKIIISDAINPTNVKEILTKYNVPKEIGILKVDIDSYDYDVYESILKLRQTEVIFGEINPVFPPGVHFHLKYFKDFKWSLVSSWPKHLQIKYGASVQAMYDLLSMNGFTIVDVDWYNFIAVRNNYLEKFKNIVPTDLDTIWRNGWFDRPGRHSQKDLVTKHWLNYPLQEIWVNQLPSEIIQEVHDIFEPRTELNIVKQDNTALSENNKFANFYQCLLAKMKNHQKGTILKTLGDCSQNDIYSDMLKDELKGLCVDAGAHVGWTSVEMAKNGHEVISIEPFEGNYEQFNEETKSFSSQITLIQGGASDSDGFACFGGATTVQTDKKNVGEQNKDITKGTSAVGAIRQGNCPEKTKVYTVDTLVSKRKVLLLKIDVQGGEFNVLKGAQKSLNNGRIKYVYFEHAKGATLETFKFLERYNYICFEDKYLFSTSNVIRVENKEIRPEKLLRLTNGLHWMEARVPFGPVSFKEWKSFYKKLPHFTQTDILCVYRETG
jgi:FkbM family methyltransferase